MTDAALLQEAGEALFGRQWRLPLAQALGVSDRTVRYWMDGRPVPEGVWGDIDLLAGKRSIAIAAMRRRLPKAA